jgi:hypothetical protein
MILRLEGDYQQRVTLLRVKLWCSLGESTVDSDRVLRGHITNKDNDNTNQRNTAIHAVNLGKLLPTGLNET